LVDFELILRAKIKKRKVANGTQQKSGNTQHGGLSSASLLYKDYNTRAADLNLKSLAEKISW